MKRKSKIFFIIGSIIIIVILLFCYLIWNFNRPPFPLEKLNVLTEQTTQDQVRHILGEPNSIFTHINDQGQKYQEWAYSRKLAWPIVHIYFSPDGIFKRQEYDY